MLRRSSELIAGCFVPSISFKELRCGPHRVWKQSLILSAIIWRVHSGFDGTISDISGSRSAQRDALRLDHRFDLWVMKSLSEKSFSVFSVSPWCIFLLGNFNTETRRSRSLHGEIRFSDRLSRSEI